MRQLPIELKIALRRVNFLSKLKNSGNIILRTLRKLDTDTDKLCVKYGFGVDRNKDKAWKFFTNKVELIL